jgi:hypothetical protein
MRFVTRFLVVSLLLAAGSAYAQQPLEPGPAPESGSLDRALLEKGPLRFEAGPFSASFHSRIQAWGGWVGGDSLLSNGDRMQEPGLRLRRVRLGVDGTLVRDVTYRVELDVFDQEKTGGPLYEAWVDWTPMHWIGATAGLQKFPFVRSEMNSSARLSHLDRAIGADAMSPTNAMGLALHSEPWKDHLKITAGVFNGLQRRSGFYQGYEPVGVSQGNKFERLSLAGRFDLMPLDPMDPGEPDLDKVPAFRMAFGGSGFYNMGKSIATLGASGYLHLKAYGLHLFTEAIWDRSKPKSAPTTGSTIATEVQRLVMHGSLGYMILKETLGAAVRAEMIDDNRDLKNEGDEMVLAGTVSWYAVGHNLKVQAEYQHRLERHGRSVSNDAAIAGVQLYF